MYRERVRTFALVAVVAVGLMAGRGHAAAQTDSEFQIWNAVLSTAKLKGGSLEPAAWFDGHARKGADSTVVILRPALGLQATPWLSAWAGYAWVPVFRGNERFDEHRFWQQLIATHATPSELKLQSRTRFEFRFADSGDDTGLRIREFVRAGWMKKRWSVQPVVWDELFIGLNDTDWGQSAGYDQNRLFVGVALPTVATWARFEAGYLFVHLNRDTDQVFHVLALNVFLTGKVAR